MKKVITLTESDLKRIVKKIINESTLAEQPRIRQKSTPTSIKGFIPSTKVGERGGPTKDFVIIQLGGNMRYGDYFDSVITQTNIKDPKFKVGTKGTISEIDEKQKRCEFKFNNQSFGYFRLVDIEINK